MSDYLIKDTTLSGIANAIRTKTGGSTQIAVKDFATNILSIPSGGGGGGSSVVWPYVSSSAPLDVDNGVSIYGKMIPCLPIKQSVTMASRLGYQEDVGNILQPYAFGMHSSILSFTYTESSSNPVTTGGSHFTDGIHSANNIFGTRCYFVSSNVTPNFPIYPEGAILSTPTSGNKYNSIMVGNGTGGVYALNSPITSGTTNVSITSQMYTMYGSHMVPTGTGGNETWSIRNIGSDVCNVSELGFIKSFYVAHTVTESVNERTGVTEYTYSDFYNDPFLVYYLSFETIPMSVGENFVITIKETLTDVATS